MKKRSRTDIYADILEVLKLKAESIQGVDIRIESGCRILGEVLYSGSLDADEDVSFAVEPKK